MARVGRYRIGLNRKAKPFSIIMNVVLLFIWLYVGDQVIDTIMSLMRTTAATPTGGVYGSSAPYTTYYWVPETNVFYNVFALFGTQTNDPFAGASGLTGVIGLILGVGVLIQAIRVTRV